MSIFKAPESGIYNITASFDYETDLEYNEDDIKFVLYNKIEVGITKNTDRKWYEFWKPKTVPVYEYKKIDVIDDLNYVKLNKNQTIFMQNYRKE